MRISMAKPEQQPAQDDRHFKIKRFSQLVMQIAPKDEFLSASNNNKVKQECV